MNDLIRAELLKLRTTRTLYAYGLVALAFVPVSVALAIQTAGTPGAGPSLATEEGVRHVMSAAGSGATLVLLIGILVMAGEFRYSTATSTFLVTPDRRRVVVAKLVASALVGVVLAVAAAILTLTIALPWLAAKDVEMASVVDIGLVLLGAIAGTALNAMVGVGVGSMIRNQTAAIVVALVWVTIVEGLLVSFVPEVGRWLPGGAGAALTGVATAEGGLLPMWGAAIVLVGYGLAFAGAGIRFTMRRDVT